jgi:hypothetical protein
VVGAAAEACGAEAAAVVGAEAEACGAEAAEVVGAATVACGVEAAAVVDGAAAEAWGAAFVGGEAPNDCAAHDETRRSESNTGSRAIVCASFLNSFSLSPLLCSLQALLSPGRGSVLVTRTMDCESFCFLALHIPR